MRRLLSQLCRSAACFFPRIQGVRSWLCLAAVLAEFGLIRDVRSAVDFDREVRPILAEHCFSCHGPDGEQRKAGLRFDTREGLLGAPGRLGPFVPGKPGRSEAIVRILAENAAERMPPMEAKRPLNAEQIRTLRQWVAEGARWQRHWAFEPVERPALPMIANSGWARNEIDFFIRRQLDAESLVPASEASREELIRRLHLDLHGLPPTPEAVDAFVQDPSPNAYERLLDRLFASPRYGERMVWNWLDAARYADSNGYQGDRERTMWPWRDWAARAFNDNMPYDEFTVFQLGGDLLLHPTQEQGLATGFNRNHMINGEGGRIPEENRVDYVMDMTETVGTVWLGLTLNCCRCHDHKFDPLSQRDYYSLFAFFNQTPVDGSGGDPQTPPVMALPTERQQARKLHFGVARQAAEQTLRQWENRELGAVQSNEIDEEVRKILDTDIAERKDRQLDRLIQYAENWRAEYLRQLQTLKKLRQQQDALNREIAKVMVMQDRAEPRQTFVLTRGLYNQPSSSVAEATPTVLPPMPKSLPRNRLGLARWLVSPSNPLPARVFVNRQWALFFGQGIVATPEDFGVQGQRPSHPELLDWLAAEFVSSNWNVKRLQKKILMSAAYRQSSKTTAEKQKRDPANRLYSRGPRYRLPSWMIRDQALAASGLLVGDIGGPPVKPYQPAGVWADFTFGKKRYQADKGPALYRRSLYTFWRRIIGPTMFFDAAKRQTCIVKSARTNTPLHALAMLNDTTYLEAARVLAERAMTAVDSPKQRLTHAFRRVTGRRPQPEETQILLNRLEFALSEFAQNPAFAEALLAKGDSMPAAALNPAEHAAYASVCNMILNLDETLSKQ